MKLLHATDFSESARRAEEQAVRLVRATGGALVLLHVQVEIPLYGEGPFGMGDVRAVYEAQRKWAGETLAARATELGQQGVPTEWRLRAGVPFEEIVRVAEEEAADVIVMGTHGRGGLGRLLLGSVADRVIRLASCPVLTVRDTSLR